MIFYRAEQISILLQPLGLLRGALLACSVLATGVSLTAEKPTAHMPIKVDPAQLKGVPNFRDIGGYKTVDGHMIRYNVLYRSGGLAAMTLSDNQKLSPLKIRYEIDLRTEAERSSYPTQWGPNPPEVIDHPFALPANINPLHIGPNTTPAQISPLLLSFYSTGAISNAPVIAGILHDLAHEDQPALLHCAGGVDRTGMTVAVLMTVLGASRKDVYHEFQLHFFSEAELEQIAKVTGFKPLNKGPDPHLLDLFFRSIDTHYGSFHAYVREGLKLSNDDVQRLRRRFLID